MDGLNKTNCGFADICKLDASNCATCKVDKASSDFHKSLTEDYPAEYGGGEVPNKMRKLADRIEAAWNRRVK